MKSIILRDHEVKRLASAGGVLVWRRVKVQPVCQNGAGDLLFEDKFGGELWMHPNDAARQMCPFGATGETRWVKEAFHHEDATYCYEASTSIPCIPAHTVYRASYSDLRGTSWTPARMMPIWHSRFRVTLTVSCRQIQSATDPEAEHSGVSETPFWTPKEVDENPKPTHEWKEPYWDDHYFFSHYHRVAFRKLINSRHPGAWERNDWFWAVECKEVK